MHKWKLATFQDRGARPLQNWQAIEIFEVGTVSRGAAICLIKIEPYADEDKTTDRQRTMRAVIKNINPDLAPAQAEYERHDKTVTQLEKYIEEQKSQITTSITTDAQAAIISRNITDAEAKLKQAKDARLKAFAKYNPLTHDYVIVTQQRTEKHIVLDMGYPQK